jgi:hypothetical protein
MGARGRPLHSDYPDEDFGQERPSYEGIPDVLEGEYTTIEGPFGLAHLIDGVVVDPDTLEWVS